MFSGGEVSERPRLVIIGSSVDEVARFEAEPTGVRKPMRGIFEAPACGMRLGPTEQSAGPDFMLPSAKLNASLKG